MSPRAIVLLLAAVAAVGLAGCGGDGGGSLDAFCGTARRFAVDNPATVFDRYDPADPSAAAELLRGAGRELRGWADDAPGEIDDDVELIADAAEQLATAFEAPTPSAERAAELEAGFREVEDASARVTAYTSEQCAVELDPAGAPGAAVTPTSVPVATTAP